MVFVETYFEINFSGDLVWVTFLLGGLRLFRMSQGMKRPRLVFSEKLMYSFIHDYKENECLWDIRHPHYKCNQVRRKALANLAAKYDITEEEVKRKLNSLRSTYLQEKKKVEESKRSGGQIHKPSLYWFNQLEFLYDVIIPRKLPPNHQQMENWSPPSPKPRQCRVIKRGKSVEEIDPEEVDEDHLIFEFVPDESDSNKLCSKIVASKLDHSSYAMQPNQNFNWKLKRRPSSKPANSQPQHQQLDELEDVLSPRVHLHEVSGQPQPSPVLPSLAQQATGQLGSQQQQPIQPEDEFSAFCSSIASQLRTLPPADAIEMQLEIQQLVSKRRLAVLKNQQIVSSLRLDAFHQYHNQHTMDNDSVQDESSEKLILGS